MPQTRGYAAQQAGGPLTPWEFGRREVGAHDVELAIDYAGICHSDIHQVREEWGKARFPMVPGHEIVGRVTAVGSAVSKFKVGELAGVGVHVEACRECENCRNGDTHCCLQGMIETYNSIERDGVTPTYGGYSQSIVTNEDFVLHVSEALDRKGIAPLLCAGITVWSPLREWGAGPGKRVAVMGLGGLGHMAVKFAAALGAHVTVISHSASKRETALAMGAHDFVDASDGAQMRALANSQDIIINAVSADIRLEPYIRALHMRGVMVIVGIPENPLSLRPGVLLDQRRRIAGSGIGNIAETQEMLDFCAEHNITSEVEVIKADEINAAYDRVVASDVKYRFVIDASTF